MIINNTIAGYAAKMPAFKAKISEKQYESIDNKKHPCAYSPVLWTPEQLESTLGHSAKPLFLSRNKVRQIDLLNAAQLEAVSNRFELSDPFKGLFLRNLRNDNWDIEDIPAPYWVQNLKAFKVVENIFSGEESNDKYLKGFYVNLAVPRLLNAMPAAVFDYLSSRLANFDDDELTSVIYRQADFNNKNVLLSLKNSFEPKTIYNVLMGQPKGEKTLNADSLALLNSILRKLACETEEISMQDSYKLLNEYDKKGCLDLKTEKLFTYIGKELEKND